MQFSPLKILPFSEETSPKGAAETATENKADRDLCKIALSKGLKLEFIGILFIQLYNKAECF